MGEARIESIEREVRTVPPPLLYDLTELQRHANRLYGLSAARTLEVAQALYERRKILSYPRTASRTLSHAVAETLPDVIRAIADPYRAQVAAGTGERSLGRRFVDDARVTDHHAIIPTSTRPGADLPRDERRIYDLVCRRLLSAWHEDHVYAVTKVVTRVTSTAVDRFASSGTSVERLGWKTLDVGEGKGKERGAQPAWRAERGERDRHRRRQGRREADAAAPAIHRRDAPHRHGNRRAGAPREGDRRRDARVRARHAGDARRDPRGAPEARVRGPRRKVTAADGEGRRAHRRRSREREEPGHDR